MEQLSNFLATDILSGAHNSSTTTFTLASTAAFPSLYPFRAAVDDEIVKVTASPGANQWTVVRGDGGTTAVSHLTGATVSAVLTKEALDSIVSVQKAGVDTSNRRILNFDGEEFDVTDNTGSTRADITKKSRIGEIFTKPVVGSFTLDTHSVPGTPTAVQQNGSIYIYHPGTNSDSNVELYVAVPGATPYTVTANVIPFGLAWAFTSMGIYFGDGTKLHRIVYQLNNNMITVDKYTAWNTFSTAPFATTSSLFSQIRWLRIKDDGTNKLFSCSPDGINWLQVASEARTTFLTTTRVGVCLNGNTGVNNGGRVAGLILPSWAIT